MLSTNPKLRESRVSSCNADDNPQEDIQESIQKPQIMDNENIRNRLIFGGADEVEEVASGSLDDDRASMTISAAQELRGKKNVPHVMRTSPHTKIRSRMQHRSGSTAVGQTLKGTERINPNKIIDLTHHGFNQPVQKNQTGPSPANFSLGDKMNNTQQMRMNNPFSHRSPQPNGHYRQSTNSGINTQRAGIFDLNNLGATADSGGSMGLAALLGAIPGLGSLNSKQVTTNPSVLSQTIGNNPLLNLKIKEMQTSQNTTRTGRSPQPIIGGPNQTSLLRSIGSSNLNMHTEQTKFNAFAQGSLETDPVSYPPISLQRTPQPKENQMIQNITRIIKNNMKDQQNRKIEKTKNIKETLQMQMQPTERAMWDEKQQNSPVKLSIREEGSISQTLALLEQHSPFARLSDNQQSPGGQQRLSQEDVESQDINEIEDIQLAIITKHPTEEPKHQRHNLHLDLQKVKNVDHKKIAQVVAEDEISLSKDSVVTLEDNNKEVVLYSRRSQKSQKTPHKTNGTDYKNGRRQLTQRQGTDTKTVGGGTICASGSSTARQSMGALALQPSANSPAEADQQIQQVNEKTKYFNLMWNPRKPPHHPKTLSQQIIETIKEKQKAEQMEDSAASSSFASLNAEDLICQTFNSRQAASGQNLGGNILYTHSSNMSSLYKQTYQSSISNNLTNNTGGIDHALKKIDKNLNTFTTDQFLELREHLAKGRLGYKKAVVEAGTIFGLEKGKFMQMISSREEKPTSEIGTEYLPFGSSLTRKLLIKEPYAKFECLGFLSTPHLDFSSNNQHLATITPQSGADSPYLLKNLLSPQIMSQVLPKEKIHTLSCGFEHCMAIGKAGVWTWGYGASGSLGHRDYKSRQYPEKVQMPDKFGDANFASGEAGGYHNGVLTKTGDLLVWGRGDVGQLGLSDQQLVKDKMGKVSLGPQHVNLDFKVKQVALGDAHTLILSENGDTFSCGWGEMGQLGVMSQKSESKKLNKITFDNKPIPMTKISCGAVFSLALSTEGQVYSWGSNTNGQIGIDQSSNKQKYCEVPQKVQITHTGAKNNNLKVVDILAGDCHALVMTADNRVYGWGQGTLIEEGEEIVCGQPVEISAGVINEMVYDDADSGENTEKVLQEDGVLPPRPPKSRSSFEKDERKDKFLPLDSIKQKALVTQRIKLNQKNLGELFTPDKQQQSQINEKLEAILNSEPFINLDKQFQLSHRLQNQNPQRLSRVSEDYDLSTIMNSADYSNFLRKLEGEEAKNLLDNIDNLNLQDSNYFSPEIVFPVDDLVASSSNDKAKEIRRQQLLNILFRMSSARTAGDKTAEQDDLESVGEQIQIIPNNHVGKIERSDTTKAIGAHLVRESASKSKQPIGLQTPEHVGSHSNPNIKIENQGRPSDPFEPFQFISSDTTNPRPPSDHDGEGPNSTRLCHQELQHYQKEISSLVIDAPLGHPQSLEPPQQSSLDISINVDIIKSPKKKTPNSKTKVKKTEEKKVPKICIQNLSKKLNKSGAPGKLKSMSSAGKGLQMNMQSSKHFSSQGRLKIAPYDHDYARPLPSARSPLSNRSAKSSISLISSKQFIEHNNNTAPVKKKIILKKRKMKEI